MANKRFGTSRQVRKVQIVAPATAVSNLSRRVQGERVSSLLGFKARAAEAARVRQNIRDEYAGTYK